MNKQNESEGYRIIVSSKAALMMKEHVAFLAQVNVETALHLADIFCAALLSLRELPYRCPFLMSEQIPRNKYRKLIVAEQYLFLYQVIDQTVYVDYIVDCRQDYEWLLK